MTDISDIFDISDRAAVIKLLDTIARQAGLSLSDKEQYNLLLERLVKTLELKGPQEHEMHGMRVEPMFAYVAHALGGCRAIKEEDAGTAYAEGVETGTPDFRVITQDGQEFFVEVKNCHDEIKNTDMLYKLKAGYVDKLKSYADLFGHELKFAIYWSRLRQWTLVSLDKFDFDGKNYSLSLTHCFMRNEMSILGDMMVATVPPLTWKLTNDSNIDRTIDTNGEARFQVASSELFANGSLITDKLERKLAWFFMRFGKWADSDAEAEVEDGQLLSVQISLAPEIGEDSGQPFSMLGYISEMVSNQYTELTVKDGKVTQLRPDVNPGKFGILIPSDYKGKVLKLWRFKLQPTYD
jgi:hypothetical protein